MRACLLTALVFACLSGCAESQVLFRFTEKPGSYKVGLKVVEQYDPARTFHGAVDDLGKPNIEERARPLQTLVWYPARRNNDNAMTVGDYGKLLVTETNFSGTQMPQEWKPWINAMAPTLKDKLWAVRDAQAIADKFPVVIYAPSFGLMAWENADLCEYLASHGYVVIASPDMGAMNRGMTLDLPGLDAQAADISFLITFARTLPDTDVSEVAVAGFSWGGLSNLLAASRDSRIRVLVALDGSMRYYAGLAKEAGIHPEQMTIPLLFFAQGEISLENIERNHSAPEQTGPNVLNRWVHGDLMTVHDLALNHTEHSSMYQRNEDVWKDFPATQKGDYDRDDGVVGYAWMARYTWKFLDAYLKNDPGAMAFLKRAPAKNGVPKHYMTTEFRPARSLAASLVP
jgi:dienelactone hydrolase